MANLLNFVLFQVGWFAAVLGGAWNMGIMAVLPAALTVLVHLAFSTGQRLRHALLVGSVTVLGLLIETAFMGAGLIVYSGTSPGQIVPPLWIAALWFAFATLPAASLAWLKGRWVLQAVLGAVLGPLSYVAGAKLGAAEFPDGSWPALFWIGLAWALALPAIYLMEDRLLARAGDGKAQQRP